MRLEPNANTHPRLLRKGALGEENPAPPSPAKTRGPRSATASGQEGAAPTEASLGSRLSSLEPIEVRRPDEAPPKSKQAGSRFLGPAHLTERQKADIRRSLKKKGIGDEMGREIFVGAVEYQLGALADRLPRDVTPKPSPQPRDLALEQILLAVEEQATLLADLILQIPKPSAGRLIQAIAACDDRGRTYGEGCIEDLVEEIDLLRRACSRVTRVEETQDAGPQPETGSALVAKLAEAFAACFEQVPTADEDGPFCACLAVLARVTGLRIGQDPESLEGIVRPTTASGD